MLHSSKKQLDSNLKSNFEKPSIFNEATTNETDETPPNRLANSVCHGKPLGNYLYSDKGPEILAASCTTQQTHPIVQIQTVSNTSKEPRDNLLRRNRKLESLRTS